MISFANSSIIINISNVEADFSAKNTAAGLLVNIEVIQGIFGSGANVIVLPKINGNFFVFCMNLNIFHAQITFLSLALDTKIAHKSFQTEQLRIQYRITANKPRKVIKVFKPLYTLFFLASRNCGFERRVSEMTMIAGYLPHSTNQKNAQNNYVTCRRFISGTAVTALHGKTFEEHHD